MTEFTYTLYRYDANFDNEVAVYGLTLGEALDLIEEHDDGQTRFELLPE